jgi:5-deoxy-glucuronate isomerase
MVDDMGTMFRPAGSLATSSAAVSITPEVAGWVYSGLEVVDLHAGGSYEISTDGRECVVLPLRGGGVVERGATRFELAPRPSVWEALPDAAYFGPGVPVVLSTSGGGSYAVASSLADEDRPSRFYPASLVSRELRGAGQASRQINGVVSADVEGPQRLIVVEVLTPAGNWSSYPPHKHDEFSEVEVPVEEVYYFEIGGNQGFGFHRTYTSDGEIDETVTVRNGDVFLVPRGYHGPCVAAPGFDMYYLNVMAGPDPQRRWMICLDPAFAWVAEEWTGVQIDPRLPMY